MKNKIIIGIGTVVVLSIIVLFSCVYFRSTPESVDVHIRDISSFQNMIAGTNTSYMPNPQNISGYGIRVFDSSGNHISGRDIIYSNDDVNFYVSITNANNWSDAISLAMFIDGQPIKFTIDGLSEEIFTYSDIYQEYSLKNIPVNIPEKYIKN